MKAAVLHEVGQPLVIDDDVRSDRSLEWIYVNVRVIGPREQSLNIDELLIEKTRD